MMPKLSKDMVEEFKSFIQYVEGLRLIKEENLNQPISDGKWTLKDIISHIMLWDKYFYEEAIHKVKLEESVTARHLDFNEFNAKAIEYAKTKSVDDIIQTCIEYRSKIIEDISGLPEEEYLREYKDGDKKKFSIRGYLRAFISHDKHHKKQIVKFIKGVS
jgi:uncharacterized damage-inducible protein DinB